MRIVDLSVPIGKATLSPPSVNLQLTMTSYHRGPGFWQASKIEMLLHTGSHVDFSKHTVEDGETAVDVALDRVFGPARVIQGSALANTYPRLVSLELGGIQKTHVIGGHHRHPSADSQLHGCMQIVFLPLAAEKKSDPGEESGGALPGGNETILLVDDEELERLRAIVRMTDELRAEAQSEPPHRLHRQMAED